MPADPVPETAIVSRFSVWKTCRSRTWVSSINATNSGSRWPSSGIPIAASTRGGTSLGPGPSSSRGEGASGAGLDGGAGSGTGMILVFGLAGRDETLHQVADRLELGMVRGFRPLEEHRL